MTTIVCLPQPSWTAGSAYLAVVKGIDMTFRGRHAAAFGNDTTQGNSAWRPPDW